MPRPLAPPAPPDPGGAGARRLAHRTGQARTGAPFTPRSQQTFPEVHGARPGLDAAVLVLPSRAAAAPPPRPHSAWHPLRRRSRSPEALQRPRARPRPVVRATCAEWARHTGAESGGGQGGSATSFMPQTKGGGNEISGIISPCYNRGLVNVINVGSNIAGQISHSCTKYSKCTIERPLASRGTRPEQKGQAALSVAGILMASARLPLVAPVSPRHKKTGGGFHRCYLLVPRQSEPI